MWPNGVNTKVLKQGTNWGEQLGFIEDTTRSGKTRRRFAHTMQKRPFSVAMRFTPAEYNIFTDWYNSVIMKGFHSFLFPKVDSVGSAMVEYRITQAPKYQNTKYNYIDVSMQWEQV